MKKREKKNINQATKGKTRARGAKRDEKGRFIKEIFPDKTSSRDIQPIVITTTDTTNEYEGGKEMKEENEVRKERAFGKLIREAMKDEYWLELIIMKTRLPLHERREEIIEIFKRHVILMGKETEMYSVKDVKNYFANFTRKGTITHKELIREIRQGGGGKVRSQASMRVPSRDGQVSMQGDEDISRYEDIDLKTGERSYYGIQIPPEAPPRPDENAVWNGERKEWEL